MILNKFTKQPSEEKDYDIDYSPWLQEMGDTLDEVTATVECLTDVADTTLDLYDTQITTMRAKFWVQGGTAGNRYKLTAKALTVGGRLDESELIFTIKEY